MPGRAVSLLLAATTVVVAAVLVLGLEDELAWLVLTWALTVPGIALVRLLRLPDPLLECLAGTLLSVSLAGLAALAQVYLGAWSPRTVLWLLVVAAAVPAGVAVAANLPVGRTQPAPGAPEPAPPGGAAPASGGAASASGRALPADRGEPPDQATAEAIAAEFFDEVARSVEGDR